MKTLKYLFIAAVTTVFALTSCLDGDDSLFNNDWKDPELSQPPFGNNSITEEGIITIAELKAHPNYKDAIANSGNKLVEDDIKLRVRVGGNDLGGNLYKQFAVQDATGGLIVAVNQGGLNGYLAEGQELIIDLKGLNSAHPITDKSDVCRKTSGAPTSNSWEVSPRKACSRLISRRFMPRVEALINIAECW